MSPRRRALCARRGPSSFREGERTKIRPNEESKMNDWNGGSSDETTRKASVASDARGSAQCALFSKLTNDVDVEEVEEAWEDWEDSSRSFPSSVSSLFRRPIATRG